MVNVDSVTILAGLIMIGVLNGLGSAIGNILAQKYVKPHIDKGEKKEGLN